MKRAAILFLGTALCVAPVALTGSIASAAPAAAAKAAYKAPRNAFGQPDLSGFWTNNTMTPMTRRAQFGDRLVYTPEEVKQMEAQAEQEVEEGNAPTDPNAPAEAKKPSANVRPEFAAAGGDVGGYDRGWLDPGHSVMRVNGEPRTSLLTTPNGQFPPRKAGAPPVPGFGGGGRGGLGSFDSYETRSMGERCIIGFGRNGGPPMFPNGFYNNNYEFIQTPDSVVIQVEMNHDLRVIRLNDKHRTDGVRPYFGDSIGWWEGDTLVVETTNIPRAQQFAGSWENLKVTERFTRVGKNRLHYQFTVDDPTIWEKPWGGEYEFAPLAGRIFEYACHEGNYALPGILGGARAEEQAAAEAAAAKAKAEAEAVKPGAKAKGKKAEAAPAKTAGAGE